jgi:hypothetical protein
MVAAARRACLMEIEGTASSEQAHAAFLLAAEKAGILRH